MLIRYNLGRLCVWIIEMVESWGKQYITQKQKTMEKLKFRVYADLHKEKTT
jgi:hypothetical protein